VLKINNSAGSANFAAKKMAKGKDILTIGEAAKICKAASRTVSRWFDAGLIKGWRLPLSGDRRTTRSELIKFMKKHGIPYKKQKTEGELPTSNIERRTSNEKKAGIQKRKWIPVFTGMTKYLKISALDGVDGILGECPFPQKDTLVNGPVSPRGHFVFSRILF
jgi:hypothetical protein